MEGKFYRYKQPTHPQGSCRLNQIKRIFVANLSLIQMICMYIIWICDSYFSHFFNSLSNRLNVRCRMSFRLWRPWIAFFQTTQQFAWHLDALRLRSTWWPVPVPKIWPWTVVFTWTASTLVGSTMKIHFQLLKALQNNTIFRHPSMKSTPQHVSWILCWWVLGWSRYVPNVEPWLVDWQMDHHGDGSWKIACKQKLVKKLICQSCLFFVGSFFKCLSFLWNFGVLHLTYWHITYPKVESEWRRTCFTCCLWF